MLKAMQRDKERFIPTSGFNVVGVDDFEDSGEQLYLIAHRDAEAEAKAVYKEWKKKNPGETAYIYGADTK